MDNQAIVLEWTFNGPVSKVWTALTDKDEMKKWYFDLAEFKAEKGFVFSFTAGPDSGIQYQHICEVTDVIPQQKLSYSWRYEGYAGTSVVSFELSSESKDKTTVKLTHSGIDSFPEDNPDLAKANFVEGWNAIIGTSLKEYLESQH